MSVSAPLTEHAVAVYKTHHEAEEAVKILDKAGYDMKNLSIIGQNYETEEHPVGFVNTGERMWAWGKLGAFWGTIWGLLFGSAMLIIPGTGIFVVAGWVVTALGGAIVGGGLAALSGALISIGIPENTVLQYESELKAGSFLLLAHGTNAEVQKAKDQLSMTKATRVDTFEPKIPAGTHSA